MNRKDDFQKRRGAPRGDKSKRETVEWIPKTELGKLVKSGEIKSVEEILNKGLKISESEIVDFLIPGLELEFVEIGQSKGKFGGGKRRVYRVTQKKMSEGSKTKFMAMCVVGSPKDGIIGLGVGTSGETVPARSKAEKNAKLNLIAVDRGCGSWECTCNDPHSIPFEVKGKSGSAEVTFMPAPKGTGLAANSPCKQILKLAGFRDVWSRTTGQTQTRLNMAKAAFKALKSIRETRTQ